MPLLIPILFAESGRARAVMQAFRETRNAESTHEAWLAVMLAAALLALLLVVAIFVRRYWKRQMTATPRGLFLELCRAHRLKRSERRLLWRLAQSQKMADPAALFLRPECFEIGRLTAEMRARMEELRDLRERLFAEGDKESKPKPSDLPAESCPEQPSTAAFALPPTAPTLELPPWTTPAEVGTFD